MPMSFFFLLGILEVNRSGFYDEKTPKHVTYNIT